MLYFVYFILPLRILISLQFFPREYNYLFRIALLSGFLFEIEISINIIVDRAN